MMYRRDAKNRSIDEFATKKEAECAKENIRFERLANLVLGLVHGNDKANRDRSSCTMTLGDFTITCCAGITTSSCRTWFDDADYASITIHYKGKEVLRKNGYAQRHYTQTYVHGKWEDELEELIKKK